jgi:hypothetical protein
MIVTGGQWPLYGVASQIANSRAPRSAIIGWYVSLKAAVKESLRRDLSEIVSCRYGSVWS